MPIPAKTIAVDFDGTIIPDGHYPHATDPFPDAKECLQKLRDMGFRIIIYTCRTSNHNFEYYNHPEAVEERLAYKTMENVLVSHGIPFDVIDTPGMGKPSADYYIDDKAIRFDPAIGGWKTVLGQIELRERKPFFEKVKTWLLSKKHVTISDECSDSPYMKRWHIFRTPWFALMLHHFLRSDFDRSLHDHPWSFVTFLLSSGYWEHTAKGRSWKRRFSILYRPATWIHRVEIPKPCWTLVLHFRRRREWGFHTPQGFVVHDQFHPDCDDADVPEQWRWGKLVEVSPFGTAFVEDANGARYGFFKTMMPEHLWPDDFTSLDGRIVDFTLNSRGIVEKVLPHSAPVLAVATEEGGFCWDL